MNKLVLVAACASCAVFAQDNPLSAAIKAQYGNARSDLSRSAEKMPEENYSFKPTPEIRSFGQLIGHVANANYSFCSAALGEKSPNTVNIEKEKSSKADLVKAITASFEYCDKAYNGMNDTMALQTTKLFGRDTPKIAALTFNNMHDFEHYGNVVTYLRLKSIVPPSSEPKK
jgi:uncharacterized damage-inducible protein DinB